MNNIYIMALEPIETRYTAEWYTFLPKLLRSRQYKQLGIDSGFNIFNVSGDVVSTNTSTGAFLNFADTNIWKNTQINTVVKLFSNGTIKSGDKFVFTDAWHPGIIQIRYMSDLLDIPVEIHSIWHAGSYDSNDFLGRKVKNKLWSYNFERAVFHASDMNYFATKYHADMLFKQLDLNDVWGQPRFFDKAVVTGFPFNYLEDLITPGNIKKENIILFPHRIAPEKQHDIFLDLAKEMPEFEFITCQDKTLTKTEYHNLLQRSKIVFSANLQETLGIGCWEGMLAGALPLVPDRLSYSEMYSDPFKYPSKWTESWDEYLVNKHKLVILIKQMMKMYIVYEMDLPKCINKVSPFFDGDKLIDTIIL